MIPLGQLDRLMEASLKDPGAEPVFFRALLSAIVFVHAPIGEESGRFRVVLFKSPDDGKLVIPVFTDMAKAQRAAHGNVRIIAINCRTLLETTAGTPIMLNPNDARCTLYPEEVRQLLRDGTVPVIQKFDLAPDGGVEVVSPSSIPHILVKSLKLELPRIRSVTEAYIAGIRWPAANQPESLVIAVGGNTSDADQNARAVISVLYAKI